MSAALRLRGPLLVVMCALSATGCFGNYKGSRATVEPVPRSERILSDSLALVVYKRPDPRSPALVLRLVRRQEIRYQVQTNYNQMRGPRKGRTAVMGILLAGAGVALVVAKGDTSTSEGRAYIVVGAGVSLTSALVTLGIVKKDQKPTGRVVPGERTTKQEARPDQPVPGVEVRVGIAGATETFTTDADGQIWIDLPARLGKGPFTGREVQRVDVEALKAKVHLETALATTEWTTACIRTTGRGPIFAQPRADSDKLLDYKAGELLALKSEGNSSWYEVAIPNGTGWVPRQFATGGCRAVIP